MLPPLDLADWHGACASSAVPPPLGSQRPVTRWGFFQNMIIDYSWPGQGEEDGQVRLHKDCLVPSQSCKQGLWQPEAHVLLAHSGQP